MGKNYLRHKLASKVNPPYTIVSLSSLISCNLLTDKCGLACMEIEQVNPDQIMHEKCLLFFYSVRLICCFLACASRDLGVLKELNFNLTLI